MVMSAYVATRKRTRLSFLHADPLALSVLQASAPARNPASESGPKNPLEAPPVVAVDAQSRRSLRAQPLLVTAPRQSESVLPLSPSSPLAGRAFHTRQVPPRAKRTINCGATVNTIAKQFKGVHVKFLTRCNSSSFSFNRFFARFWPSSSILCVQRNVKEKQKSNYVNM